MLRRALVSVVLLVPVPATAGEKVVSIVGHAGVEVFDYRERLTAPLKSTEHGPLFAFGIEAATAPSLPLFVRASVAATLGRTTYDGTTQSGAPRVSKTSNLMISPELVVGPRWTASESLTVAPFVGLGYRFWRRDLAVDAPGGYAEDYRWWSVPLGVLVEAQLSSRARVGVEAAVVPAFGGAMDVSLSNLPLPNNVRLRDVELEPEAKVGARVRVPFSFAVSDAGFFGLLASYEYSELGSSPVVPVQTTTGQYLRDEQGRIYGVAEPPSRTHRYGVVLRGGVSF